MENVYSTNVLYTKQTIHKHADKK